MVEYQKFLNDTKVSVARTLKAGLDLDCGDYYTNHTLSVVQQGKVREIDIDNSLKYLYVVLMRLGWFHGNLIYNTLGKNDICSQQNIELAEEAAREGIVLLKNDVNTLPLDNAVFKNLALVGTHFNATLDMIGNYAGIPCRFISPIDVFSAYGEVNYAKGCNDVDCKNDSSIPPAIEDAENADICFAKNNSKIKSILRDGYPGEEGGLAIADVVFGKYNPGGRLPLTWHEGNYVDKLPMTSMQLRPVDSKGYPGRTYKFFNGSTVHPFGYGLSYTLFQYNLTYSANSIDIKLDKLQDCRDLTCTNGSSKPQCHAVSTGNLKCNDPLEFEIVLQNVGKRDGSEVVMVYSKPPEDIAATHFKQVICFQRGFVAAGQSQKVKFVFNVCKSLRIIDYAANSLVPSGWHKIIVGEIPLQVNLN